MSEQRGSRRVPMWALVAVGVGLAVALIAVQVVKYRELVTERADRAFRIERTDVPAPALSLTTFGGGRFSLDQAKGQVVFVNFWATWCPPCVEEMPSMTRLAADLEARYPGKFRMVAVSVDEGWEPVATFFGGQPPESLTVALDQEQMTTRAWFCGGRGQCSNQIQFPETYIVDRRGRLVAYVVGPRDWSDPAAVRFLERLITD